MTTAPRYPLIDETCLTRLGVMVVQGPHQAHLTPGDLSRAHVKGVWLTREQALSLSRSVAVIRGGAA